MNFFVWNYLIYEVVWNYLIYEVVIIYTNNYLIWHNRLFCHTFYPSLPIFLHRYICHICDISQLCCTYSLISPSHRSTCFVFPPHLLPLSLFCHHQIGSSWLQFGIDNLLSHLYLLSKPGWQIMTEKSGMLPSSDAHCFVWFLFCSFSHFCLDCWQPWWERLTSCDRFVVIGFRTLSQHDCHITTTCNRICICIWNVYSYL